MGRTRQLRTIRVEGEIAFIPLTKGYEAIIDATDVPLAEGANWYARVSPGGRNVYAGTATYGDERRQAKGSILLHRLLTDAPAGMDVDHIDHNGLNNRRSNLRVCTHQQNMANMAARNPLGLKGVKSVGKRFSASIQFQGSWIYLGLYETAREAGAAYRGASLALNGEYGQQDAA